MSNALASRNFNVYPNVRLRICMDAFVYVCLYVRMYAGIKIYYIVHPAHMIMAPSAIYQRLAPLCVSSLTRAADKKRHV